MAKINQYPAKTVPSNNDEFILHDPASGSTKKMTRGDLIGGAPLPANSVNGQAIADGSVTLPKVGTFKLGYSQKTSNQQITVIGSNIEISGLDTTVTIPAGGKDVEIEVFLPSNSVTGASIVTYAIWDGAIGGTQIGGAVQKFQDAGDINPVRITAIISSPAAGNKTIRVSANTSPNNTTIQASSTRPAFMVVKAI